LLPTFDVVVIGGGPAGIAAAVLAAECGVKVAIVDDNAFLGGQIWRKASSLDAHATEAATWFNRVERAKVATFCGKRVFYQPEPGVLICEGDDHVVELRYHNLVLATGARERFLPFPGWTLPNVMGAGGLQAMVKSGLPIGGKRVVVAGTGPLLLAVAAYLRKQGAEIPILCEQASWGKLARFGLTLLESPKKFAQALQLTREMAVTFAANAWPVAAHGTTELESVTISRNGQTEKISCNYLACGFHLVPNVELPALLGCEIRNGFVQTDELQRTTVPGVYCAGEPTSIGGLELSLVEGQIAGLAAAGNLSDAARLFRGRKAARRFARRLEHTFFLRNKLRTLPSSDTIVCRCEDVRYSRLRGHTSWRSAKLHTRCGMGACQGRVCGPATEFMFKWSPDSVRPPLFPARVDSLAAGSTPACENVIGGDH
jgi:NADPH-dependent 2,4-dienoyl-CoA reductase/sulfur reductase-like enzyme